MDATDRALITLLQDGIAIEEHPFRAPAAALGISEDDLLARLARLRESGTLSRFGPMFDAARMGGHVTLCALAVPPERYDSVTAIVNAHPEVAHNYAREHPLNMWFVVAAETQAAAERVLADIAAETGLAVHDMPKLDEYFIRLRLVA